MILFKKFFIYTMIALIFEFEKFYAFEKMLEEILPLLLEDDSFMYLKLRDQNPKGKERKENNLTSKIDLLKKKIRALKSN